MDVSVISSGIGRQLFRKNDYAFESAQQDYDAIAKDGKDQFIKEYKPKFESDPQIAARINGVRYKLRTFRVRTA
jgi:hypothetical protein